MSASLRPARLSMAMMAPSGQELLFGGAFDLVLDVGLTEQLQRAQVEVRGARHRRATPQTLECDGGDALLGQEHGRRQADQAAASDQDWCLLVNCLARSHATPQRTANGLPDAGAGGGQRRSGHTCRGTRPVRRRCRSRRRRRSGRHRSSRSEDGDVGVAAPRRARRRRGSSCNSLLTPLSVTRWDVADGTRRRVATTFRLRLVSVAESSQISSGPLAP